MNLLEQIIRKTLFENTIVGKLHKSTTEMNMNAHDAGASYSYTVLVRGTTDTIKILDTVVYTTQQNPSVGKMSNYATDQYVYVCSNPVSKKRQTIDVWIMPISILTKRASQNSEEPIPADDSIGTIGGALMFDKLSMGRYYEISNLKKLAGYYNSVFDTGYPDEPFGPVAPAAPAAPLNQTITYPYTILTGPDKGDIVYTMAKTDLWVYIKVNDEWWTLKKSEFESKAPPIEPIVKWIKLPKTKTALYTKLNALIK